jgi:AraC-like DNA-binding protein
MLVLKIPRVFLDQRTPVLDLALNRSLRGGLTAIAGSVLGSLWEQRLRGMSSAKCEAALALAGDLVATALADIVCTDGRSGAQLRLLLTARRDIETNLADPTLTATQVAERLGVSTRYLHKAFSGSGESFSHYLKARRLERCHRALSDPFQASRSIAAIAYGWGFTDARHFARLFRTVYGRSPSERRAAG